MKNRNQDSKLYCYFNRKNDCQCKSGHWSTF